MRPSGRASYKPDGRWQVGGLVGLDHPAYIELLPGVTLVALRGVRCRDSESSVDDLGTERGVVYGRAVATLRSVETQPLAWGIRLVS